MNEEGFMNKICEPYKRGRFPSGKAPSSFSSGFRGHPFRAIENMPSFRIRPAAPPRQSILDVHARNNVRTIRCVAVGSLDLEIISHFLIHFGYIQKTSTHHPNVFMVNLRTLRN